MASSTVAAIALVAIALAGFSGAACRKSQTGSETAGTDRQDPYALMKDAFFANPRQFQVALASGAAASARRNLPDATLTVEEQAVVTNLGHALRAIVAYRGEMPAPGGSTQSLAAEVRQYFHPKGAVIVETTCVSGDSPCQLPRELIDRTDTTVLQHLSDDGIDSLLPRDAECEASPMPMRSHVNRATVCRLGPDVQLSVMRLSVDQTRAEFP